MGAAFGPPELLQDPEVRARATQHRTTALYKSMPVGFILATSVSILLWAFLRQWDAQHADIWLAIKLAVVAIRILHFGTFGKPDGRTSRSFIKECRWLFLLDGISWSIAGPLVIRSLDFYSMTVLWAALFGLATIGAVTVHIDHICSMAFATPIMVVTAAVLSLYGRDNAMWVASAMTIYTWILLIRATRLADFNFRELVALRHLYAMEASVERRKAFELERDAIKQKSQFLSMVSHELRSPLQSVLSALDLLELGRNHSTERRVGFARALPMVRRAVDALSTQVNDLLTLARGEAGRLEMRPEPFEASALVLETTEAMRPTAEQKKLTLRVEVPEEHVFVVADPARISQVLNNLVGNALKYTSEGTVIVQLRAPTETSHALQLRVSDTGPGIPDHFVSKLFQPFQRAAAVAPGHKSSGIGLSVVSIVLQHLGGTIEVSTKLGGGTTFEVTIPVAQVDEERSPDQRGVKRVLVVDDRLDVLEAIADVIRALNHSCDTASSPGIAANMLAAQKYDVALFDLDMPVKNGHELASEIRRANGLNSETLILAVSAAEAAHVGDAWPFDGFLAKPVNRRTLSSAIERSSTIRSQTMPAPT